MPTGDRKRTRRIARHRRVRLKVNGIGKRPRFAIFRSLQHIYAQLIEDGEGRTVVSASSLEKALAETLKTGADKQAAIEVGKLIASRAKEMGVEKVVFDRGGYRFHGRIKALADAAREAGLNF